MKELLVQFSAYHTWANQQLLTAIGQLSEAQQHQEVVSSFPGVYKTILHLWDAESIWWQRVRLQERITRPSDGFTGDMKELGQQWLLQSRQWNEWIAHAQEHMFQHVFHYQDSKREQFKQPVAQALLHLFNHGTYHRGQLVTLLRQLGVEKIPNTDFISWSRKKSA